jgi:hypothetical protein
MKTSKSNVRSSLCQREGLNFKEIGGRDGLKKGGIAESH